MRQSQLKRARPLADPWPERHLIEVSMLQTVLVVDPSIVARALLVRMMKPHCDLAVAASGTEDAQRVLRTYSDLSLIILESGEQGLELLEHLRALETRPATLVIASHPTAQDETQALLLGAIGYLPKPISLKAILRALRGSERAMVPTLPRARSQPLAHVVVVDPDSKVPQVIWDIHDMSASGALITSHMPLPPGTQLQLLLQIGEEEIPLEAEVVRPQEPAWDHVPGVGVSFRFAEDSQRRRLEDFLSDKYEEP